MTTALLIVGCIALLVPCYLRFGLLHPLTITVALWLFIGLLFAAHPADLVPPATRAVVAILLGLTALAAGPLVLGRSRGRESALPPTEEPRPPVALQLHVGRLALATLVVLAAVGWGVLQYRSAVSAALGRPFDQVDPKLVRWAELYGDLTLSGKAGVALALAPLLGAFAVIGGLCHRWWWYLLLPVALAATMQSPSRTATLTVVVASVFFFVLLSRIPGAPRRRRTAPSRWRTVVLFSVAGVLGLAYFGVTGQQLDKADLMPGLRVASWLPTSLVQPMLYQLGSVSGFSAALHEQSGGHGPYGAFGRSIYAVVKLAQVTGVHLPTPKPYAAYVEIPVPFNTYTAFGDAYFDMGLAGVVVLFLVAGLVLHALTIWPRPGHPGSTWALSLLTAALVATPIHARLLDGDILIPMALGCALVAFVLRPRRTGGQEPPGVPVGEETAPRAAPPPGTSVRSGEDAEVRGR